MVYDILKEIFQDPECMAGCNLPLLSWQLVWQPAKKTFDGVRLSSQRLGKRSRVWELSNQK
ncbi:hypothetical protein GC163_22855 [bacterium]|nr:hypothetical protein [bacterium]